MFPTEPADPTEPELRGLVWERVKKARELECPLDWWEEAVRFTPIERADAYRLTSWVNRLDGIIEAAERKRAEAESPQLPRSVPPPREGS